MFLWSQFWCVCLKFFFDFSDLSETPHHARVCVGMAVFSRSGAHLITGFPKFQLLIQHPFRFFSVSDLFYKIEWMNDTQTAGFPHKYEVLGWFHFQGQGSASTSGSFVGMKKSLNVLQTQNSAKIFLQELQNHFKRIYLLKRSLMGKIYCVSKSK